jgi:hypothetical protein
MWGFRYVQGRATFQACGWVTFVANNAAAGAAAVKFFF